MYNKKKSCIGVKKMNTKEAKKLISKILGNLPYATDKKLEKLASDEQIVDFINKAIQGVYSEISRNAKLKAELTYEMVKSQVIDYFDKKINATRSSYEQFDYESVSGFASALKISASIKETTAKQIKPEVITINREHGEIFLANYESNITKLERSIAAFQNKIPTDKPESEFTSAQKNLLAMVNAKREELRQYKDAVSQIKSEEPTITILFPPFASCREISQEQIAKISKLDSIDETNPLNGVKKFIRFSELSRRQIELSARKINPQFYDIEKIEKIVANLGDGFVSREITKAYLEGLAKNLVSRIDTEKLSFPLSGKDANAIESLINFKKYIIDNKAKIAVSPKTVEILDSQNLEKLEQLLEGSHRVNRHERLQDRSSSPSNISKHLTQQEHDFLQLFDKIITHGGHSTSKERSELSLMLERSVGDMDFNKRLDLFTKEKHPLADKYKYSILDIKYFGFKAKSSSDYNLSLLEKCEKALKQIEQGTTPSTQDQMTLFELGRLEDLAKLKEKMDKYNELGLIEPSSKLSKLYEQVNRAANIFDQIEEQQSKEQTYRSGDMLMTHSKKSLTLKNKSANSETALTHTFISKYGHATQIYIDPETNQPKLSHIYGGYQSDEVRSSDIVMSEVFRVDPIKLMSEEMQKKLDEYYKEQGLDYKEEVRKLFEQNVQSLHADNQERFQDIKNDKTARFRAGLADFGLYEGHTKRDANDFSQVHEEMYGAGAGEKLTIRNKMICSEFVARSLVAALHETNENLKEKLGVEGSASVIKIPLERENLHRVHPERLIKLLHDQGCLERVHSPSILQKLVNHENLDKKRSVSLQKPGKIFYDELVVLSKQHKNDTPQFKIEATRAFERYAEREKLDLDFEDPKILNFLDNSFSRIHDKINDQPNIIVRFFRSVANFLGFKPEAQKIVEETARDLEKVQIQSIRSRYSSESEVDPELFGALMQLLPKKTNSSSVSSISMFQSACSPTADSIKWRLSFDL